MLQHLYVLAGSLDRKSPGQQEIPSVPVRYVNGISGFSQVGNIFSLYHLQWHTLLWGNRHGTLEKKTETAPSAGGLVQAASPVGPSG